MRTGESVHIHQHLQGRKVEVEGERERGIGGGDEKV